MKHVLLEYQAALFLAALAPIYLLLYFRRFNVSSRLLCLCGTASLAVLVGLNTLNLGRAGFLWHDEPNILSIAAAYLNGQPMYHRPGANSIYSLLYGPSTYLVYLPFLSIFSRPITAIRIAGFAINLGNVTMLFLIMRQRVSKSAALGILPVAVSYLLSVPFHIFGIRGDQVLLLCLTAALMSVQKLKAIPATFAVGVLCGFALDFKITVAPIVCLVLYFLWRRRAWLYAAAAAALTVGVAALPFFLQGISWSNYTSWLALSRQQGFQERLLIANLLASAFLLLPGTLLRVAARRGSGSDERQSFDRTAWALFILCVCSCVLTGSKNGAGPWHLLPLLPFIMLWTADAAASCCLDLPGGTSSSSYPRRIAAAIAAAAMLVTLRAGYRDLRTVLPKEATLQRNSETSAQKEIFAWANRFPGQNIAMGYGRLADDPRSSERFELALAGKTYFLDESALVESIKDRIPMPPALQQRMLGCEDLWLIPHDEVPFTTLRAGDMPDDGTPFLFPDAVRNGFSLKHSLVAKGTNYDVWACQPGPRTATN